MSVWTPRIPSVLRVVAALLFMEHGLMKLFHFPIAQPGVPNPLPTLLIIAASIEIVVGALLTIGLLLVWLPSSRRARWRPHTF